MLDLKQYISNRNKPTTLESIIDSNPSYPEAQIESILFNLMNDGFIQLRHAGKKIYVEVN